VKGLIEVVGPPRPESGCDCCFAVPVERYVRILDVQGDVLSVYCLDCADRLRVALNAKRNPDAPSGKLLYLVK